MAETGPGRRPGSDTSATDSLSEPDATHSVHVQSPPVLWLWFALLVLLPIVGGLVSFSHLRTLNVRVAHAVGAQEGQTQTILALSRIVRLTERAAMAYERTREPGYAAELKRCNKEFKAASHVFPALEGAFPSTKVERELSSRHVKLCEDTAALLEHVDRRELARRGFRKGYKTLSELLDAPVARTVSGGGAGTRGDALARFAEAVSITLGGLEDRVLAAGTVVDAPFVVAATDALGRFEDRMTGGPLTGVEFAWLAEIKSAHGETLDAARELGRAQQGVRDHVARVDHHTDELDAYLVNELQPRLVDEAVAVRTDVERARQTAGAYLAGFSLLGILAGSGVALALSRKTIRLPPRGQETEDVRERLRAAGVHIDSGAGLEQLGDAFARMVENVAQSEEQLRDKEARLRMILENAADGMVTINQHGAIESFNAKAKEMFGYREVEVLGKNVNLLMPDPHHSEHDGHLERFLRTRESSIMGLVREVEGLRKSGETFPMELVVSESRVGKRVTYTGIVRDITQRKEAERRQAHLIRELEAKNAEMERFTYTVSHDLKSPLITIRGFLGLLEQDLESGDRDRVSGDLDHIRNAVTSMQGLLTELLELSRVGRIVNPPQAAPLEGIVKEAVELLAGPLAQRGVEISCGEDMPSVMVDRPRLVEVLQNLIENAVKFMGDQEHPCIDITASVSDERVVCAVRDNGVGIDPRHHERVFGLFERLDQGGEGTGIGLALVKRIVELHEGRIWIESEGAGRGSTFFIELPVHEEVSVAFA